MTVLGKCKNKKNGQIFWKKMFIREEVYRKLGFNFLKFKAAETVAKFISDTYICI